MDQKMLEEFRRAAGLEGSRYPDYRLDEKKAAKPEAELPALEPEFRAMIGPLATKMEWDVFQAALFAADLLEDVNWHELARKIRDAIKAEVAKG